MENGNDKSKNRKHDGIVIASLVIGGLLLIISFLAPYIFTSKLLGEQTRFNESSAQTGDTFGIMNPFIALVGISLTFLAFYMQYKANQLQREISDKAIDENQKQFQHQLQEQEKQYKIQQFESHFFEMLRLHKDNVNEIQHIISDNNVKKGRVAFNYDMIELHRIIDSIINPIFSESTIFGEAINKGEKPTPEEVWKKKFEFAYSIFYWGESGTPTFSIRGWDFSFALSSGLYTYKSERHSYLGHYYRHLFQMVKFIVDMEIEIISEDAKMKYLKLLRAQLSNYEQIMLFYNWLSGYGSNWEIDKFDKNENITFSNQYFTKYKMIHNLWTYELYQQPFAEHILNTLNSLKQKSTDLFGRELLEEDE